MSVAGTVFGRDGWTLTYDLQADPGHITAYNTEGTRQWIISGAIDQRRLEREISHFLYDHNQQQLRMDL